MLKDKNIPDSDLQTFMAGEFQIILYNDSYNTCEYVITCLMKVFDYSFELAKKIMIEAHLKGKTIAQVESLELALGHSILLISEGLIVELEHI